MDIRIDFLNYKEQLEQFIVFAEAFSDNDREWGRLRNREDFSRVYVLDDSLKRPFERIYERGRDLCISMREDLVLFNEVMDYPTIEDFLKGLKEKIEYYLEKDEKIYKNSLEVYQKSEVNLYSLDQMFSLFEKQINILKVILNIISSMNKI